jgi:hypothetical protein
VFRRLLRDDRNLPYPPKKATTFFNYFHFPCKINASSVYFVRDLRLPYVRFTSDDTDKARVDNRSLTGIFCSPICHDAEKVTDSLCGSSISMVTSSSLVTSHWPHHLRRWEDSAEVMRSFCCVCQILINY